MERRMNTPGSGAVRVNNISPAVMKLILAKIQATTYPKAALPTGNTSFDKEGSFYKIIDPDKGTTLFSIQSTSGFNIDADVVKDLEQALGRS
jgi:hypothetical protein